VLFGSIFIGAVHDFGALVVSLRNRGQTVGDIAGRLLNHRVRILFLVILLFSLWIVLAIFGLVIASVFKMFPASILPVFLQIPIAVGIGVALHRKSVGLAIPSALALGLMYLTVWFGAGCPGLEGGGGALGEVIRNFNLSLRAWPIWAWTAVLLVYCYIASVLPVWVLLQPRDYINSLQLISTLVLVLLGLVAAATIGFTGNGFEAKTTEIVAPALQREPLNAPDWMPFLFMTIACGAISGFHCLVSSGTSSKQLRCEPDAQFVGYGSMLTEGFLAVVVILAVAAGIGFGWPSHEKFGALTGSQLWHSVYGDWNAAKGLETKIGAFVVGSGNFIQALGIHPEMAVAIMGVLVASFAGTTLDTATRLQRYVVQELSRVVGQRVPAAQPVLRPLHGAHGATLFAVLTAFVLAIIPRADLDWTSKNLGTGGLNLWPMFGATNQLLAGFAFLVICFWLWRRKLPVWFAVIPAVFMLVMPAFAMLVEMESFIEDKKWLLVFIGSVTLALEAWMIIEAVRIWPKARGVVEEALPPLPDGKEPALSGAASEPSEDGGRSC